MASKELYENSPHVLSRVHIVHCGILQPLYFSKLLGVGSPFKCESTFIMFICQTIFVLTSIQKYSLHIYIFEEKTFVYKLFYPNRERL